MIEVNFLMDHFSCFYHITFPKLCTIEHYPYDEVLYFLFVIQPNISVRENIFPPPNIPNAYRKGIMKLFMKETYYV